MDNLDLTQTPADASEAPAVSSEETTVVAKPEPSLKQLQRAAVHLGLALQKKQRQDIESTIELGAVLGKVKARMKHGEFGKWAEQNLPFTARWGQKLILLSKNKDAVLAGLAESKGPPTIETALRLVPKRQKAPEQDADKLQARKQKQLEKHLEQAAELMAALGLGEFSVGHLKAILDRETLNEIARASFDGGALLSAEEKSLLDGIDVS